MHPLASGNFGVWPVSFSISLCSFFIRPCQFLACVPSICIYMCVCVCVCVLYLTLCDPMDCRLPGSSGPWDLPSKNTGAGYHFLLQGIFPTQGSCFLHWQADSLPQHHLGSLYLIYVYICTLSRTLLQCRRPGFDTWIRKIPCRGE